MILRNGLYSSDELRDLELEIVRASDLFRERSKPKTGSILVGGWEFDLQIPNWPRETYGVDRSLLQWPDYALEALQTRTNRLWDLTDSGASQDADKRRERVNDITDRYQLARESYRRLIAYEGLRRHEAWGEPAHRDRRCRAERLGRRERRSGERHKA